MHVFYTQYYVKYGKKSKYTFLYHNNHVECLKQHYYLVSSSGEMHIYKL